MSKDTLHNISRRSWNGETPASLDQITAGSLQRIADSLEKIEKPFDKLIKDNEYYRKRYKEQQATIEDLRRSNAALRGHLTRAKKKLEQAKAGQ